jgi:hypothetical protein
MEFIREMRFFWNVCQNNTLNVGFETVSPMTDHGTVIPDWESS